MQNDTPIIKTAPFTVVREIILPESKYRRFQADLLAEAPFIAARTQLTGYSEKFGRFRCLLVTARGRTASSLTAKVTPTPAMRRMCGTSANWIWPASRGIT